MGEIVDILVSASFWAVRIASPLIFASMGALICERAGVLNLGIEGIMVIGAFAGWMAAYAGMGLWPAVAVAMASGMAFGLLHAILTVPFGLSQHVVGLGITFLATSVAYFSYRIALPEVTSPPKIEAFQVWEVPVFADIPVLGPALFQQTPMTYLAFVTVLVVSVALFRTPLRLAVWAAGENPQSVAAQGLSVTGIRIGAVMFGSGLMAVGGEFLTMSAFNAFFFEMVNGSGWICIALVVFGAWKSGKALLGAFDALQIRLQQTDLAGDLPYQVFLIMPCVLSIAALVFMSRRGEVPRALMQAFNKGER